MTRKLVQKLIVPAIDTIGLTHAMVLVTEK